MVDCRPGKRGIFGFDDQPMERLWQRLATADIEGILLFFDATLPSFRQAIDGKSVPPQLLLSPRVGWLPIIDHAFGGISVLLVGLRADRASLQELEEISSSSGSHHVVFTSLYPELTNHSWPLLYLTEVFQRLYPLLAN